MKKIIAIDAGTSNLRIRIIKDKKIIFEKKSPNGVKIGKELFIQNLYEFLKKIFEENKLEKEDIEYIVASGMITSSLGLKEVKHIKVPVNLKKIREKIEVCKLKEFNILLIPGIKVEKQYFLEDNLKSIDVIRGEETEVFGILDKLDTKEDFILLLPGSHNKIIEIREKNVVDFTTTMSGELYEVLTKNTILKNSVEGKFCNKINEKFLLLGYEMSKKYGINQSTFMLRGLDLAQNLSLEEKENYLLGIIIEGDIKAIYKNNYQNKYNKIVIVGNNIISNALYLILKKLNIFSDIELILENDFSVKGAMKILKEE
ncbi:2-dehydro-3-deoxygalactonokinase [Fusobacterium perfoetens]|uniref:2-dehydro-3-deoxygalactonokinase n=1 Tax=Fusobacterium perfoetens TaxID=852 RepID=UPI0004889D16|nr:2-dehydro-3-deoxygalactonokinase [Fusobacterium perfoetens]MCI6152242.1 2-dehydro-3-deoxygalactonokinase [Fusobacterium perfoetens]MDY3237486.1 2-dehydro-3-deoxygalactonokinase [Fusobacterium perfoetens]